MKFIKPVISAKKGGYCYGCGQQCNNDCKKQRAGRVQATVDTKLASVQVDTASMVRK